MRRSMAVPAQDEVDAAFTFGFATGAVIGGAAAFIGALMAFGVFRWPW